MKNFINHLLSALCLIFISLPIFAEDHSSSMQIFISEQPDEHNKGTRTPAAPTVCTIDFDNHRIETSIPYAVTAYELWEDEGIAIIVSYPSDYDMVEYMSGQTGVYQLRIVTSDGTYAGYLEL